MSYELVFDARLAGYREIWYVIGVLASGLNKCWSHVTRSKERHASSGDRYNVPPDGRAPRSDRRRGPLLDDISTLICASVAAYRRAAPTRWRGIS